jgi:hypothetical protein
VSQKEFTATEIQIGRASGLQIMEAKSAQRFDALITL